MYICAMDEYGGQKTICEFMSLLLSLYRFWACNSGRRAYEVSTSSTEPSYQSQNRFLRKIMHRKNYAIFILFCIWISLLNTVDSNSSHLSAKHVILFLFMAR